MFSIVFNMSMKLDSDFGEQEIVTRFERGSVSVRIFILFENSFGKSLPEKQRNIALFFSLATD